MNKRPMQIISLVMVVVLLLGGMSVAEAANMSTRASDYFWYTDAWATPTGNGSVIVEFDVSTTDTMKEVGATQIVIYEQQSTGVYKSVKTFTRYNTTGMIDTNCSCNYCRVSYSGTAGTKYYAVVTFYAKDANGSETLKMTTKTITA